MHLRGTGSEPAVWALSAPLLGFVSPATANNKGRNGTVQAIKGILCAFPVTICMYVRTTSRWKVWKLPANSNYCTKRNMSKEWSLVPVAHRLSAAFSKYADLVAWAHGSSHIKHDLGDERQERNMDNMGRIAKQLLRSRAHHLLISWASPASVERKTPVTVCDRHYFHLNDDFRLRMERVPRKLIPVGTRTTDL